MYLGLKNEVALITGSSQGIGKAIARCFLSEGCRTVITGRQHEKLMETKTEFDSEFGSDRILAFEGDMTQKDIIENMLRNITEKWGKIDCLVANIGTGSGKAGWNIDEEDWYALFEANFWGSVKLVKEVLSKMIGSRHGTIVFISSITGKESTAAPLPYSAAKAAIMSYSKNLARMVGPYNVRVNCIAPGNILSPNGSWERNLSERREEVMNYITNEVALQRFGRPEEIADLAIFLSSERSSFITGACIVADGGQTRSI